MPSPVDDDGSISLRARYVPDGLVTGGASRTLTDKRATPPTCGLADQARPCTHSQADTARRLGRGLMGHVRATSGEIQRVLTVTHAHNKPIACIYVTAGG
jgi:hypothetical protein